MTSVGTAEANLAGELASGVWRQAPASGWATMSGPGRWRVLAGWGGRPQLVHRRWFRSSRPDWRLTFPRP